MAAGITLEELEGLMAEALDEADETVKVAWSELAIPKAKWACIKAPRSESFWVVGLDLKADGSREAIWYNHFEEGFNRSPYGVHGNLDEYWCNQDSFAHILGGLPAAQVAEVYAEAAPDQTVPDCLREGGQVVRRQTTYWDLQGPEGQLVRAHFTGMVEHRFTCQAFDAAGLWMRHEVLACHHQDSARVFASGMKEVHAAVQNELAKYLQEDPGVLRLRSEYVTERTLAQVADGFGCIFEGPASIAQEFAARLVLAGAVASVLIYPRPARGYQALVLGRSFVVAESFRFRMLSG
jgi:hypothetical protein